MARFYFEFQLLQDIAVPIGGVVVTNRLNVNVHGKNSLQYWVKAPPVARKGALVRFRQTMELLLAPGEYVFMVGLSTMGAADYARLPDMDSSEIIAKQRSILRVARAGSFWVRSPASGPGLPFYGCADLKGDSVLSVLQP
jgi:lipopolysaccharide transport system ATP-binding protein